MTDVPHLSRHDLEDQLERLYSAKRSRRSLFAFYGTGQTETIRLDGAGEVQVVPVQSELDLRARMPALGADDRIAFLVPWSGEMPLDLSGRFVQNGRIMRIGREARLRRLFGVGEIESAALKSPLVDHLLRPGNDRRYLIRDGRLTADAMWAIWLDKDWSVELVNGLASLMAKAAVDDRGPAFVAAMEQAAGVREALLSHLSRTMGPAGPVVWRAWETRRGRELLEYAVLLEPLMEHSDPAVGMWIRQRVRPALGIDEGDADGALRSLGREVGAALRSVVRDSGGAQVRALVRDAEARVDEPVVRTALEASRRLPLAWTARLEVLGAHLMAAATTRRVEDVTRATDLLRDLDKHEFFKDTDQTDRVRRVEMAVRLLSWLASDPEGRIEVGPAVHADAEALGAWYAAEGGFVDWARRWARGSTEDTLGRGIDAVVQAADELRQRLDRRFAKALPAWLEAGRPQSQVVPIDRAVERIAARFLEEDDSRRLLVLLLDGMAWAQAAELLLNLGDQSIAWGPLAWHFAKKNKIGESIYPVMFAGFPTITEVSRSAFFAGKVMEAGKKHSTQKDPERWKTNKHVTPFFDGIDAPPLMLRGESHDRSGAASTPALSMVADSNRRVVAVVVNVIDESLKADRAHRHPWTAGSIASMADLLNKARESGRAVLFCSDHGHVPSDRLQGRSMGDGGARWRPLLDPNEVVAEDEVVLKGKNVWCPKGAHGVVLLADDTGRYGPVSGSGEHGGASLAEVVTPCLLIGSEDTVGVSADDDPGQAVRGALVPSWWYFDVAPKVVHAAPEPKPTGRKPKPKNEKQLVLPTIAPEPSPVVEAAESAFAKSEILAARAPKAESRKEAVKAVDFLMQRNGVVSRQAFAAQMGVVARRVPGLVAKLQELLNLDGYEVLRFSSESKQVELDVGKLRMLFELDG